VHGLVLFATKLETVDTSEVTVLNTYAPPLYSASSAVKRMKKMLPCVSSAVESNVGHPSAIGLHGASRSRRSADEFQCFSQPGAPLSHYRKGFSSVLFRGCLAWIAKLYGKC